MNRIEKRLNELNAKNEKAMITYIMSGLPNLKRTMEIVKAEAEAGVDVVELGIPFSDPVADGPVIQDAGYRSILNGTNLKNVFEEVVELRKECEVPVVFMLYYNTVMHYGIEAFVKKCMEVGVDGFIIPDLPYEEQFEIKEYLKNEDAPFLIPLVSPVSKQRIPMLLNDAKGFVYCVSAMGVTGQSGEFYQEVNQYLQEVKQNSTIPVMMGFGITSAKDVLNQKEYADGFVIGSAFIKLMESCGYDIEEAKKYVKKFKKEINS